MQNHSGQNRLSEYNDIIKENDNLYRGLAKNLGLSECAFWILYVLRADNAVLTQSEICEVLYQAKQTVNSALKNLEAQGSIELLYVCGHRGKQIRLTKQGLALAERTVDKVIAAEHNALLALTDVEQQAFIGLFRKYTHALKDQMRDLEKKECGDNCKP